MCFPIHLGQFYDSTPTPIEDFEEDSRADKSIL